MSKKKRGPKPMTAWAVMGPSCIATIFPLTLTKAQQEKKLATIFHGLRQTEYYPVRVRIVPVRRGR